MALFNIFKSKEEEKAPVKKIRKEVKKTKPAVKKPAVKKPAAAKPAPASQKTKKVSGAAYRILKEPHVTEKATDLTKVNQYVFKVYPAANKTEIKRAVEDIYGVNVDSVQIVNIPPKKRRLGKTQGWSSGYKKAVIRLREGQKIEILPR